MQSVASKSSKSKTTADDDVLVDSDPDDDLKATQHKTPKSGHKKKDKRPKQPTAPATQATDNSVKHSDTNGSVPSQPRLTKSSSSSKSG